MSLETPFANTEHRLELLGKLKEAQSSEECYQLISEYYPGWLVGYFDRYSYDYPSLEKNWLDICAKLRVDPVKILIVSSLNFDQNHTIQEKTCDFLMEHGYVIRRDGEFIGCSVCGYAIPCIELWGNLKYRGIRCPEVWNKKCTTC